MSIGKLHENHRQRLCERYEREGAVGLEPHEMLELFLFDVIPRRNTNTTAHLLINRFGSLYGVFTSPYDELVKVDGVGDKTARYIIDSYEEFCRSTEAAFRTEPLCSFEAASNYLLWHSYERRNAPVSEQTCTMVLLDEEMYISDVYESDIKGISELKSRMKAVGACSVLIGVSPGFELSHLDGLYSEAENITDVILTDGAIARSLTERDRE